MSRLTKTAAGPALQVARPPLGDFDAIRGLLAELPGPDEAAADAARAREALLAKPPGALGRLEDIAVWGARWQGRHPARALRIQALLFAGNHGVAARGVSAWPQEVTAQMVENFLGGGAAVSQLCGGSRAILHTVPLALDSPTADFTEAPAMTEAECADAFARGHDNTVSEAQLLCLGEMGIGNTAAASALCLALFGGGAEEWTGRGAGIDDAGLARKRAAVAAGAARHSAAAGGDGLEALRRLGGRELAAIAGAIVAARRARILVLLDGFVCCAAAAALQAAAPGALDHCLAAHLSTETGHARLLERLGLEPLLDLGMRLGEASGAVLAAHIVRAAFETHEGMATFAEAKVSERAT